MRSLDEWHKYVELQAKRVSSAKLGQSANQRSSLSGEPSQAPAAESNGDGALDDLYVDGSYTETASIPGLSDDRCREIADEPLPDHLKPTPLPALIEFAADDISTPLQPAQPQPRSFVPVLPLAEPSLASPNSGQTVESAPGGSSEEISGDGLSISGRRAEGPQLARNGRAGNGSAYKETREELLARLLDPELTLEEAAQVLNVCPTTVRRYTNRGVLPHHRTIGNQRRFRLSQVLAFLEAQDALARSQGLGASHVNGAQAERPLKRTEEP